MSQNDVAQEDAFSPFAVEMDRIADENDVIFVVPTGNYTNLPQRGWVPGTGPDEELDGEDRVAPPGDAALAISVGSLSDSDNAPTASPTAHPSPFSRRGPGPGMLIKPDVVHFGGTCGKNMEAVQVVRGPHLNGAATYDIGTSFAAPKVAAQTAELVNALQTLNQNCSNSWYCSRVRTWATTTMAPGNLSTTTASGSPMVRLECSRATHGSARSCFAERLDLAALCTFLSRSRLV